jgi:hypothetical protein
MNCERIDEILSDLIEDRLPLRRAEAINAHLRACPRCQRQVAEMRALVSEVRSLEPAPLPVEFGAKVRQRLELQQVRRARPLRWLLLAPAAAAAAALVVYFAGPASVRVPRGHFEAARQGETRVARLPAQPEVTPAPRSAAAPSPAGPARTKTRASLHELSSAGRPGTAEAEKGLRSESKVAEAEATTALGMKGAAGESVAEAKPAAAGEAAMGKAVGMVGLPTSSAAPPAPPRLAAEARGVEKAAGREYLAREGSAALAGRFFAGLPAAEVGRATMILAEEPRRGVRVRVRAPVALHDAEIVVEPEAAAGEATLKSSTIQLGDIRGNTDLEVGLPRLGANRAKLELRAKEGALGSYLLFLPAKEKQLGMPTGIQNTTDVLQQVSDRWQMAVLAELPLREKVALEPAPEKADSLLNQVAAQNCQLLLPGKGRARTLVRSQPPAEKEGEKGPRNGG